MAFDIHITVDEAALRRVVAGLRSLESKGCAMFIAEAVGKEAVLPALRDTPSQSGKPMAFTSSAQRRAFFAKLRSGAIKVPYERTGALVAGWRQAKHDTIENAVRYAELVQGERGKQAAYHAGNWKRVDQVAAEVEGGDGPRVATGAALEWADKHGLS